MPNDDTSYYADLNGDFDSEGYGDFLDEEVFEDGSPNHADLNYQDYLWDILSEGHESGDRTGTGTIKSFGHQMRFDLTEGFPLLTSKTIDFENVARELLWFLRGQTNIWHLLKNDVGIWTGNAYARYKKAIEFAQKVSGFPDPHEKDPEMLKKDEFEQQILEDEEFAETWGDLGPIYGKQWRRFGEPDSEHVMGRDEELSFIEDRQVDQIARLVDGLQTHPDTRRHIVDAWDPAVHGIEGKTEAEDVGLSPCHYGFQCFTRELSYEERYELWQESTSTENLSFALSKPPPGVSDEEAVEDRHELFEEEGIPRRALSLMWNQRSVDSFLGLPYNIASYALLTHLLAHRVNMVPEEVIFSGGDCHIYKNHLEQVEELLSRTPRAELPQLKIGREQAPDDMGDYQFEDFSIEGYDPRPNIEAPLAV